MDRRKAIKNTGLLFGGMAFSTITLSQLSSCQSTATGAAAWKPSFLSVEQGQILRTVADILIPTTDTPGALDAGVPELIDQYILNNTDEEGQQEIQGAFKGFLDSCQSALGKAFSDCTPEEQLSFLQKMEKQESESNGPAILRNMKGMIYRSFFTSKEGMELLGYEPIPGDYQACVPISECTDFSNMR